MGHNRPKKKKKFIILKNNTGFQKLDPTPKYFNFDKHN